jgi:hypothetical protein
MQLHHFHYYNIDHLLLDTTTDVNPFIFAPSCLPDILADAQNLVSHVQ